MSGSSKETDKEEVVPAWYVLGSRTQDGFWVMERAAYAGFSVTSALWASSGVRAPRVAVLPVGTVLKRSFDHLTFGRRVGGVCGADSAMTESDFCKGLGKKRGERN